MSITTTSVDRGLKSEMQYCSPQWHCSQHVCDTDEKCCADWPKTRTTVTVTYGLTRSGRRWIPNQSSNTMGRKGGGKFNFDRVYQIGFSRAFPPFCRVSKSNCIWRNMSVGQIYILMYTDGLFLCEANNDKRYNHSGTVFGLLNCAVTMPLYDDRLQFINNVIHISYAVQITRSHGNTVQI